MGPAVTHARVALNRLYADYADEPRLAHMRAAGSHVVPGTGAIRPRYLFIGEAPGRNEERLRIPFIGASGRFLDEMLRSVNILRTDIFITNYVKYRPVDENKRNRAPTEAEGLASIPYLRREWRILGRPPVVLLGKHARNAAAKLPERMYLPTAKATVGEWFWLGEMACLPLHHPAFGLYQQKNRPMMFEQFRAVLDYDRFLKETTF